MNPNYLETFLRAQNVPEKDIPITVAITMAKEQKDRLEPGSWFELERTIGWKPNEVKK